MDGKETAQGNRERQHPLAHRYLQDDMVHQMGRSLCHAPRAARGADAATMLRENLACDVADDDQVLGRARALAARIAAFPPNGVPRIKTSLRAAAAGMRARDWFAHAAAHDPLAGRAGAVKPRAMARPAPG